MKRLLITSLIALGLLYSGSALAATALSDTELAGVSGGGIDPHLNGQSLPQDQSNDQQQPGSNNSAYTPPRQPQTSDGMELAPELFAILQSTIDVERDRTVLLDGTAQQNAVALNLENLNSSDIVSTSNILEGSSISLLDITYAVEINQANNLSQLHRTQGSLDSSVAGHRYEKTVEGSTGAESYYYHAYSLVDRHRVNEVLTTDIVSSSAGVGSRFTSLDQFTSDKLPFQLISQEPIPPKIFDFPPFGYVADLGWFGDLGAEIDYTGIQLFGPGLRIDSIDVGGTGDKDLLIGTRVTMPKLDFGDIKLELCAGGCTNTTWDLKYIGGYHIYPSFKLSDMAPEVEELNLGAGFDFSGTPNGEILTVVPGSFTVDGDVYIKVTPYVTATLDVRELKLLKVAVAPVVKALNVFGNGKAIIKHTWSFDLVNDSFDFELLNEDIEIPDIDLVLGNPNHFFTERVLDSDNDILEVYDLVDVAESSFSDSYEHTVLIGGRMTGAEAELLAMSEGTLSVDNTSNVSLTEGAQQNIRVLNGVNAASSIAANAMNISRLPSFNAGPSAATPRISVQQHNRFNQQL
jgi:hypothetical protein